MGEWRARNVAIVFRQAQIVPQQRKKVLQQVCVSGRCRRGLVQVAQGLDELTVGKRVHPGLSTNMRGPHAGDKKMQRSSPATSFESAREFKYNQCAHGVTEESKRL